MTAVSRWCWIVFLTFFLLLLVAVAASAQEEVGGLYGTVMDSDSQVLPGVRVVLDGMGAAKTQYTDAQGKFRFLGLDPGLFGLKAALDGFSTVEYPKLEVRAGRNTTVEVQLTSAIGEVITVTSETPLLDERKISQGSIVTQLDLEAIPTARDPWAVLNQAPGVLLDQVNVGGNESASQSIFIAPAAESEDNHYLVDGVEITDSLVGGGSPTYYDFDQFSQFEISTGGGEITKVTAGVSINMVTKRGTNEFRGSARYFVTDADGYLGVLEQGEPTLDPGELGEGQEEAITGNRINRNEEYGFEAGGPAWRDRIWLWGSWANTHTNTFSANGLPQEFLLENVAVKLNAQIAAANSFIGSWSTGNKTADARGAGPGRSPESTWIQRGPTDIIKVEDTHVFGSSLFISGAWGKVGGGFGVTANGGVGPDAPEPLVDSDGVVKRNAETFWSERPSEEWKLDGSHFISGGAASHELKFGARFRDMDYRSAYIFPGRQLWHLAGENFGAPPGPLDFFSAWRAGEAPGRLEYSSVWLQDTVTRGQWTLNGGLRWDYQKGVNEPAYVSANPAFPELLPALDYAGDDAGGFDWETVSPRLGATYAVGQERQTLLRASYARFAKQLNGIGIWRVNPVGYAYAYFYFLDANDNNTWDGYDEDGQPYLFFWGNFDPTDPDALESPNINDPNLDAPVTDEFILSVEHSFLPEFVVGLDLTYRQTSDTLEERQLVRQSDGTVRQATQDDFFLEHTMEGDLPDGSPYAVDFYALNPDLVDTGGSLATNGDRKRGYRGLTLRATKRLANQWMLRSYLTYGKANWSIPDSFYSYKDPTDFAGATWTWTQTTQDNDGDLYFDLGRRGSVLQSSWAFNVNGMYQLAPDRPWGFNVAGNLYGREGYPLPYFVNYISRFDGINRAADAVREADQFRADDIFTADLRLEKEFSSTGNVGFTFSIDAFNILNENMVLRRELLLTGSRPDYVNETLSPRIFRLGVRLNWR